MSEMKHNDAALLAFMYEGSSHLYTDSEIKEMFGIPSDELRRRLRKLYTRLQEFIKVESFTLTGHEVNMCWLAAGMVREGLDNGVLVAEENADPNQRLLWQELECTLAPYVFIDDNPPCVVLVKRGEKEMVDNLAADVKAAPKHPKCEHGYVLKVYDDIMEPPCGCRL